MGLLQLLLSCIFLIGVSMLMRIIPHDLQSEFIGKQFDLFLGIVTMVCYWTYQNRQYWREWVQAANPLFWGKSEAPVRLSIAYLFKIEIDGKYLLIRNHRDQHHSFQPVGGVYKYFRDCAADAFRKLGITPDTKMPNDHRSECDLRVRLNHRFKLPAFLQWFDKRIDREIDPWREFYEELIEPNILSVVVFPYLYYNHIGQHRTRILPPSFFPLHEFLLADIYEPILSPGQRTALKELQIAGHPEILWATQEDIEVGHLNGYRILPHTKKLFSIH